MGYRTHVIRANESLQTIAQRMLGDANRWSELALLNDLTYPYITEDGGEGIKAIGDKIKLPILADPEHLRTTGNIREEDQEHIGLGVDLFLSTNLQALSFTGTGDLEVDVDGDLKLVSGVGSLRQDLTHRIMTELGSLPYHPNYGSKFTEIIGEKQFAEWETKAGVELSRTLLSDARVTEVVINELVPMKEGVSIDCTIYTSVAVIPFSIVF